MSKAKKMEKVKLNILKENPDNPRFIKDSKFKKLVKSIKEFPEMLEKRPIVVDEDYVVLGGNMRLKACQQAGLKEVYISIAKDWSDEKKKEFVIKDNIGYGEWDWELLGNQYQLETLENWGLDVLVSEDDLIELGNPENSQTENVFATELDAESNYLVLKFDTDIDWIQAKTLFGLKTETARRQNGKEWSKGIGRVLNGVEAIKKIKNDS